MSYSLIPSADYKAACDAIRAKTGKTDLIKSGDMAAEIGGISGGGGGASFNIHYGATAPSDTSKLWVKTNTEPTETRVASGISGDISLETLSTTLPAAVHGISAGVVGTKVYLIGADVSGYMQTINVFDTATNTIETLSTTLPSAVYSIADSACVVGTKIYLFGGRNSSGGAARNTILVFDTATNTIETLSTTLPSATYGITAGVVGTKIYLFGGYSTSNFAKTIYVFDTATNTIETLSTTLPKGAASITAGVVGNKVYLFGGNTGGGSGISTINVFDTATNTIETLSTTLPTVAYSIAVGVVGTKVYLFGGWDGKTTGYLNTINVFDTATNTIETLSTTLPSATYGITAGVVGTKIYLFGGESISSKLNTINLFTTASYLAENTAAVVPSLTENVFQLIDLVELGVSAVFIGNADGAAEQVNAYLHNGTEWALI